MTASKDRKSGISSLLQEVVSDLGSGPLIRRLRRSVVAILEQEVKGLGVGPVETLLLRLIRHKPSDTETLRSLAALDMVSFSKSIRNLLAAGLVETNHDRQDRRRRIYVLTATGRVAARKVIAATKKTETVFLSPLSPRDRSGFMRLFTRVTISHAVNGAVQQDPRIAAYLNDELDPGTLLRRARQISAQFFEEECADLGLPPIEAETLELIGALGSIKVKALSHVLDVNRGSAFTIVAKLERADYLDQSMLSTRTLGLSPKGKSVNQALKKATPRIEERFLKNLSAAERRRIVQLMRKLSYALSSDQ